MAEARLAAHVWVGAYLRRLSLADIPAYVTRHGDDTAGAIMVKCATLDGNATLWRREWDFESDTRPWTQMDAGTERDIDQITRREASFDPDLWVIEIESRDGLTLLDQDGLV
ncbi:DUF1491 family protein [Paracoccus aurantiacus]|uniref:DUF1491 family protein n=1 Tax=Paracoccus aurantiacus TaxID=2599412 RepID=A0A5C6S0D7_9RHOB|nr:DUF1491 family protein [Paracoccus aurantiacus]TXB68108.1 DUF1491 family protein [Paracoccus aurantiacus]